MAPKLYRKNVLCLCTFLSSFLYTSFLPSPFPAFSLPFSLLLSLFSHSLPPLSPISLPSFSSLLPPLPSLSLLPPLSPFSHFCFSPLSRPLSPALLPPLYPPYNYRYYWGPFRMLKSWHTKDWCALSWSMVVWDPSDILLQEELEKVQKRAARFVTGKYNYETGSMTGILEQL